MKRALVGVYDKREIIEFCRGLNNLGFEIIATSGTAELLRKNKIPVKEVSEVTGFPEILDGRVKTLHPKILGGILALRQKKHLDELKKHGITPIDMVICNMYPFKEIISKKDVELKEALENIDIGGVTMIRAAAKNFENVVVVVNPDRYDEILNILKTKKDVDRETRSKLAIEAFNETAKYDFIIQKYLTSLIKPREEFPELLDFQYNKIKNLRYGENPHQKAALYSDLIPLDEPSIVNAKQIAGKDLSWTNILDLDTALEMIKEFKEPFVIILKHMSPCGASCGKDILDAYVKAYEADSLSAFGGVVGLNRKIDLETAKKMAEAHFDCIIATGFDEDAVKLLSERKALRLLKTGDLNNTHSKPHFDIASILGGVMLQEHYKFSGEDNFKVVTKNKPTKEQFDSLLFAWKIVRYVKSNAIILVKDKTVVGIGVGQTSRVDSAKTAINKACEKAKGSLMASDGFFPFRDSIDNVAKAGITAIIQPGGSVNDSEIIKAANEYNIPMIFTGIRCFRH
jgi:phosphoribosylaminoimidazolecarboxamide formyltransferase/IMP cyclohydrolase